MPAFMKRYRSSVAPLRFCRPVSFPENTVTEFRVSFAVAKTLFSLSRRRIANCHEAIALPQISCDNSSTLELYNQPKIRQRARIAKNSLAFFNAVLLVGISCAAAMAQTATTTSLTVSPASGGNGSVFTMTATVKAGSTLMTGGTVSFRDTYNGVTQLLGTVQVQSAHGTRGNAVLLPQLGGIGTHSIVATYNGTSSFANSSSLAANATVTGLYSTTTSLAQTGGTSGNWSLTATIVGLGTATLSPTGTISLLDTTNANWLLGSGVLGSGTAGYQIAGATGSPVPVGNKPQSIVAGDFSGDGFVDLAVLNGNSQNISILKGDGTGAFTVLAAKPTTGNTPVAIATADFDGDGDLDLVVANSSDQTISFLSGNGNGSFNARVSYSVAPLNSISAIAIGDFNGDGIPDIAVAGSPAAGGAVIIMQNNGSGVFTKVTPTGIVVGTAPSSIAVGDFDGDGNLDLAVANKSSNTVTILRGDGSGTNFTSSTITVTSGSNPSAIVATDLDADGRLDLVVAESNNSRLDIYRGNGNGTFTFQRNVSTGNTPASIVAGDFDSNGHIDLAVANSGSATASVLLGNGDFTFQAQKTSPTGTSPISITSGDFNGDGNTDVAVANNNSNNVSILLNQLTDTATASFTGIDVPGSGSNHNVEATYPGDGNFNPSTSTTVALGSTKISTSTLLSASTTTPAFGQQVVLTATLVPSLVGALTPTGTVTFKNGGATLGTATVSGGLATLNVTSLTAGIHSLTAIYAGDTNFVTSTSPALGVTVSKATPVITWPTPSPITYGTLLSSLQQNASTTAAGTFAYNPAPFTLLSVGTYTLSTTFTPTDSTDYTIATASVTLVVNPATPQIYWPTPGPISFGTPLSGIQLNATVSVYNIVPLSPSYNVTGIYTDGSTFGVPPGGFDGTGAAYSSNLLGNSVTWNNITYPLGPTNAPDAVANTTVTLPAGHYATLNLLGALVNGNVSTASTFVVTYTDGSTTTVSQQLSDWVFPLNYPGETVITCVPYRNTSNGTKDAHLTCVFGYQIALDSTKIVQSVTLPATRNNVFLAMALVSPPVPGTLVYTPPAGTVLSPGVNTLSTVFTPTDTTNFTSATGSVQELVNPANTINIVWPTPAPITYGTALSSTQLNAVAQTIPGTTSVSLASYYRVNAYQTDGSLFSTGGFDNNGNAFSANQLGSSLVWNGQTYSLGPPNLPSAVSSTTIALPQGHFYEMTLVGAATTTGQTSACFTLNFTDGTNTSGCWAMSSWTQPASYPGETIVSTTPYINTGSGGRTNGNAYLYGYQIPIEGSKVVQSLILPNNRNIVIVAMSLSTSATPTAVPGTYTYTPPAGTVPNVGTVPLNVLFTPTDTNYQPATATVNLVVNKAPLVVTANNETTVYGTTRPPYTYAITGFVNGDTQATATTGAPSLTTTPATPTLPGTYPITAALGTLASANYSLSFAAGTLTITKPTLTVTAANANRAYGAANPTFSASATGAVNGDTFTFTESTVATPSSPVGTYAIVPVASGANLANYNVVYVSGTLTIGQATLTVTAANASRAYGTANPAFSASATGALPGDTFTFTESTTATTASPVGTYPIVPLAAGASLANYTVVYVNGTLTVGKAVLTVTAGNQNIIYGATLPTYTATITGFLNGDTQATAVTGAAALSTTPATPVNAGTYPINAAIGTLASSNYSFSFVPGTLTIGQATLTVTAANASRAYGTANPAFSASATGALPGDTFTFTESTTATTASPVGTYPIVPLAAGASLANYTVVYVNGTLTVGKAILTVTAGNQNIIYGAALPTYTATITGFLNGDTQATAVTGAAPT